MEFSSLQEIYLSTPSCVLCLTNFNRGSFLSKNSIKSVQNVENFDIMFAGIQNIDIEFLNIEQKL